MSWKPKNCVVAPIDFSPSSPMAVREAISTARHASVVRVIHILPKLDSVSPGVLWGEVTDESRLENARTYLDTFLASHDIEGVQSDILIGDPGLKIVKYATDCNADLIVIPSHGYHGIKHMILGSVAERVIRHAECAVYVLRRLDAD